MSEQPVKPASAAVRHALRWRQENGEDFYDPFNPRGPWVVECACGEFSRPVRTRHEGRAALRAHKNLAAHRASA